MLDYAGRDFKIIRKLGSGGQGEVFLVENSGKFYALKRATDSGLDSEIRILQDLQGGPGIPKFITRGRDSTYTFFVMELLGATISDHIKIRRTLYMGEIAAIAYQLLNTLEWIHSKSYVHADLKGGNIFQGYTDPQTIYLADFGVSDRYMYQGKHLPYRKTGFNDGTIEYMSLDVHKNITPSRRSDLESLGYLMVKWYLGYLPWDRIKKPLNDKLDFWENLDNQEIPQNLKNYFKGIKMLEYSETPDYDYLRTVITTP